MTVQLEQVGDEISFRASNASGYEFAVASEADQEGISPMEMVATSLGGCSSIDILTILRKQRQRVNHFDVQVEAERATDRTPAVFTTMHVHYRVEGDVAPDKVRRAINLSLEKYCSVSKMLEKTASISYSFTVNGQDYAGQRHDQSRHRSHSDAS